MSSSSDIEKLFDHFGGDANAYQEIGRENEARSARTRWPLLVTLDLTQPVIPAIGQHREPKPEQPVSAAPTAIDRQDTTPKDVASVTRAKAPLFTRSHRRDIPPVVVAAAQPAAPSGASRFGSLETEDERAVQNASAAATGDAAAQRLASMAAAAATTAPAGSASVAPVAAAPFAAVASVPPAASAAFAPVAGPATVASAATPTRLASIAAVPAAAAFAPTAPIGGAPSAFPFRAPATQTPPAAAPAWIQAPAPAFASAPAFAPTPAFARAYGPASPATPATPAAPAHPTQPSHPPSILGKLFAVAPQHASPQPAGPAAPANESVPLQSVFDRLRGASAPPSATPADASRATARGVSNSWLVNGPRRS
jgi:hypothetical protein